MRRAAHTGRLNRSAAQEQGRRRTDEVVTKVRIAMAAINSELASNDGVYPQNKGRLSLNEVARRADIHNTTLHAERFEDLLAEVKAWMEQPEDAEEPKSESRRRTPLERLKVYRDQLEGLEQSHRDTNLELQQAQADLGEATRRIEELITENERLLALVSNSAQGKLVKLPSTKGR